MGKDQGWGFRMEGKGQSLKPPLRLVRKPTG